MKTGEMLLKMDTREVPRMPEPQIHRKLQTHSPSTPENRTLPQAMAGTSSQRTVVISGKVVGSMSREVKSI